MTAFVPVRPYARVHYVSRQIPQLVMGMQHIPYKVRLWIYGPRSHNRPPFRTDFINVYNMSIAALRVRYGRHISRVLKGAAETRIPFYGSHDIFEEASNVSTSATLFPTERINDCANATIKQTSKMLAANVGVESNQRIDTYLLYVY